MSDLTPDQRLILTSIQQFEGRGTWYTIGRHVLGRVTDPGRSVEDLRWLVKNGLAVEQQHADETLPRLFLTEKGAAALAIPPPSAGRLAQAAIDRIVQAAHPLLATFADASADHAALMEQFRPQPGDAAQAFAAEIAAEVEAAYERLWREAPPRIEPKPGQSALHIHPCPAGMFGQQNALTAPFPGGYTALAPYLNPQRVWLTWRYVEPGAPRGMAYNGLVWIDRWVWFPKPYRVVGRLISQ